MSTTITATSARERPVILVGNPNVGKSVLFTKLTGKFVIISNYPGTTVEIARGQCGEFHVLDTPGLNDLTPATDDARVTCAVLREHADAVLVQVADAKNLRRALVLTQQLAALGRPMVLVVNMLDELDQCGGKLDVRRLSELLSIPVVPTIATANTGIHLLKQQLEHARVPMLPATDTRDLPALWRRANDIVAQCYRLTRPHRATVAQKLGWWATQPGRGWILAAAVLAVMFWFVGLLGAGVAVDLLESGLFGRHLNPLAIRVVDALLPFPHEHQREVNEVTLKLPLTPTHGVTVWESTREVVSTEHESVGPEHWTRWDHARRLAHDFLVGPYGQITMALSYALAIVLPIVTSFFLLFSVLEDSGYLPRLAVMVNRLMRRMGLNGKAVLPMILGLGCDTMAAMTTRILETRKERVVTTLLLALAVPCSAQLGVLLAMLTRISFAAALFWVGLITGVCVVVGWLAARLHGGAGSDFIMELPPMRRPQWDNVIAKTLARLKWYLWEVVPLFMAGTAVLFGLHELGWLERMAAWTEPLVTGWLGLPRETAAAFLIGFLRRDYGAVYLLDAATGPAAVLTAHQVLVAMVTITLFMPCVATLFMIHRELGWRTAAAIALFVFPFAFFMGGVVHHVGGWLGL
ncbi:MAG: ferrous iron transporter B [Verrucomicrobiae bacterium]|nr:ferrous iron transporter B [Verrucomicrobiae bacterium]